MFQTGRRRRSGGIVLIQAAGTDDTFRFGLVAGRKVGGAVERNRVKRRIRHAMRSIPVPAGADVVVIASPEVLTAPFSEVVRWLADAVEPNTRPTNKQEKPAP